MVQAPIVGGQIEVEEEKEVTIHFVGWMMLQHLSLMEVGKPGSRGRERQIERVAQLIPLEQQ